MTESQITVGDLSAFLLYAAYVGISIGGTFVNFQKIFQPYICVTIPTPPSISMPSPCDYSKGNYLIYTHCNDYIYTKVLA